MVFIVRQFDRGIAALTCLLVASLLCCVLAGVITREFDNPLIWTDELSRFLMIWLAASGWILATRHRGHVRIRYFHDFLPRPAWRAAGILFQLGLIIFGVATAYYSVELVRRNLPLEATTLPISMAWMYVPMIPVGAVMALQAFAQLLEQAHGEGDGPLGEGKIE